MAKPVSNMAASIRARLRNLARDESKVFDVVLVSYGLERLIYRLSVSEHRDNFVLKGGMLVTLWTKDTGRFTRDADFLGLETADEDSLRQAFAEILAIECNDGLVFDTARLSANSIREDQIYGGVRLRTQAMLGNARIPIIVDIGFGDAISNPSFEIEYPSLLDLPSAKIRAYSPETVMAEKMQALVALGVANGRMKDYYDLRMIPRKTVINHDVLKNAVQATFSRRNTEIPEARPVGLTEAFYLDTERERQWVAYAATVGLEDVSLNEVCSEIWFAFKPICSAIRS